jgi:hypothetical protein
VAGTYAISLRNNIASVSYVTNFVIPVASNWIYVSITVPGCTTGTWLTDTNCGVQLGIHVNGSTSGVSTSSTDSWIGGNFINSTTQSNLGLTPNAMFSITGVQLEKGSLVTPFEWRPRDVELSMCRRYYERVNIPYFNGYSPGSTWVTLPCFFKVTKRGTPTVSFAQTGTIEGAATVEGLSLDTAHIDGFCYNALKNATAGVLVLRNSIVQAESEL